ncbi:hypothetical protein BJV82DRAFT_605041, partial [Fennellomyces sp. T-0311]
MYLSQVPATFVYTLLKTVLLIMFAKTIESICSWVGRYDVVKVMEQGSYTVLFGSVFTRNYRNFMTILMAAVLFVIIAVETATNLLPTVATKYMPFQLISFTSGDDTYFPAIYNTPVQSNRIPSMNYTAGNPMQEYCDNMGLCTNGEYPANIPRISPTMKVSPVQYNYHTHKFHTAFVNVTTPYCLVTDPDCDIYDMILGRSDYSAGPYNVSIPGLSTESNIYFVEVEESESGAVTLSDAMSLELEYRNETGGDTSQAINTWATLQMLYRAGRTDIISVTHLSSILYTNGRETVVLVLKAAIHNLNSQGPSSSPNMTAEDIRDLLGNVFNNSGALYNATFQEPRDNYTFHMSSSWMAVSAFTHYTTDPYLSIDLVQKTMNQNAHSVLKARIHIGVFVITDAMPPIGQPRYYNQTYMTNFNSTRSEYRLISPDTFTMRQPGFYDQMFDGFNDPPTDDLFMYAVLSSSDHTMFGTKGYQEVVADISLVFLGVLCVIILLMCIVFFISRYTRDELYFASLYQTLGHVGDTGRIGNISSEIPQMSMKDRKIFVGGKVLLVKDKKEPLGLASDDYP